MRGREQIQGRQRSGTDYSHDRLIPYLASRNGAVRNSSPARASSSQTRSSHPYKTILTCPATPVDPSMAPNLRHRWPTLTVGCESYQVSTPALASTMTTPPGCFLAPHASDTCNSAGEADSSRRRTRLTSNTPSLSHLRAAGARNCRNGQALGPAHCEGSPNQASSRDLYHITVVQLLHGRADRP